MSGLVWAKMRLCHYWPAKIVDAPPELGTKPEDKTCVLFFGTKNFGFIDEHYIVDYIENREKYIKKGRGRDFKDAVARMDEYIQDPLTYASNAYVKPIAKKIKIKRERAPNVKEERDVDVIPFESVDVHCAKKDNQKGLLTEIDGLKAEKTELVQQLIRIKEDNQNLYLEVKSKQRTIATLEGEQSDHRKNICEQQQLITHLTREVNIAQAKIKQLMSSACANTSKNQLIDGAEDVFEVESILDHMGKKGRRRFLIRWQGYPPESDTWEKESNLKCPTILQDYLKGKGL